MKHAAKLKYLLDLEQAHVRLAMLRKGNSCIDASLWAVQRLIDPAREHLRLEVRDVNKKPRRKK